MKPASTVLAVIAAVLFGTTVAAQQQQPSPPGTADPVRLTVSRQNLLIIGQALQELPAKVANPILNDLQAQLTAADKAFAEVAKRAEEAKRTEPAPKPDDQKAD